MNYRHLTEVERYQIQSLRGEGLGLRAIGQRLDRSAGTISWELRRNATAQGYQAKTVIHRARCRCWATSSRPRIAMATWAEVERRLREKHSPEQIAGRLRHEGLPGVSHERVYQYLVADRKEGGTLWQHRRCGKLR